MLHIEVHLNKHDFLVGGRTCLADFVLMGPLYGHLSHNPVSHCELKGIIMPRSKVSRCWSQVSWHLCVLVLGYGRLNADERYLIICNTMLIIAKYPLVYDANNSQVSVGLCC